MGPHENHEVSFMMLRIHAPARRRNIEMTITERRFAMQWETPQAIDLRFGMEITMYIANR